MKFSGNAVSEYVAHQAFINQRPFFVAFGRYFAQFLSKPAYLWELEAIHAIFFTKSAFSYLTKGTFLVTLG